MPKIPEEVAKSTCMLFNKGLSPTDLSHILVWWNITGNAEHCLENSRLKEAKLEKLKFLETCIVYFQFVWMAEAAAALFRKFGQRTNERETVNTPSKAVCRVQIMSP